MNKKAKLIIIVAAGILAMFFIWRFFNQYLYRSKAAGETMSIEYLTERGANLDNINTAVGADKVIKLRIKINGTLKISGFSLKLETDKGLSDRFIKINSIGTVLSPGRTVNFEIAYSSLSDYFALYTWVYKIKTDTSLPTEIILPVTIQGLKNGCGKLSVTQAAAVGPVGRDYSPSSLPIAITGNIGSGSCAPVPTRTSIPEGPTLTPTVTPIAVLPTLVPPVCSNPQTRVNILDRKITFSFDFDGKNSATATNMTDPDNPTTTNILQYPQCFYSDASFPTPSWIPMTIVPPTLIPTVATGGRPYSGNTRGKFICEATLDPTKSYKTTGSTYVWFDLNNNRGWNQATEPRKICPRVESSTSFPEGPTLTPTPTLSVPACTILTVPDNPVYDNGKLKFNFSFQGNNVGYANLWVQCYYTNTPSLSASWKTMRLTNIAINPEDPTLPYGGNTTGRLTCESTEALLPSTTYTVQASVYAYYGITRSTDMVRTICPTINGTVTTPDIIPTSTPTMTPTQTPTPGATNTPTPTNTPGCNCNTANNTCTSICPVNQPANYWTGAAAAEITYTNPMKCAPPNNSYVNTTGINKDSFCNSVLRPKGDVNRDGRVDFINDYMNYIRLFVGGKIEKTYNPDVDGNGLVTPDDGTIIRSNMQ